MLFQQLAHQNVRAFERGEVFLVAANLGIVTPVVLQQIESPIGELLDVLGLMLPASGKAGAGPRAGRRVDAGLQPARMDVVGQPLHVGEMLVGQDVALRIAERTNLLRVGAVLRVPPAIVDIDVLIADVGHPFLHHHVGGLAHQLVGNAAVVGVPVVPAHRRRERERVAADDLERPAGLTPRILYMEADDVLATLLQRTGDLAGFRIDFQPVGQALNREFHRPRPGGGNRKQERTPRPHAEHPGPVDPGRGRGLWRQDDSRFARGGNDRRRPADCGDYDGSQHNAHNTERSCDVNLHEGFSGGGPGRLEARYVRRRDGYSV